MADAETRRNNVSEAERPRGTALPLNDALKAARQV